jgi:hypothetical protein
MAISGRSQEPCVRTLPSKSGCWRPGNGRGRLAQLRSRDPAELRNATAYLKVALVSQERLIHQTLASLLVVCTLSRDCAFQTIRRCSQCERFCTDLSALAGHTWSVSNSACDPNLFDSMFSKRKNSFHPAFIPAEEVPKIDETTPVDFPVCLRLSSQPTEPCVHDQETDIPGLL